MIVTVKEATATRSHLISDRKTLTQQLNDYKRKMRETASEQEMTDMRKAMEDLNSDLELRNAQIQTLQKQITEAQNSDANGGHHVTTAAGTGGSSKVRFESIRTMTEARIVLEHLFEKNVEGTISAKELRSEFTELKQLYDESVKNTNTLETEIAAMKGEYEAEKVNATHSTSLFASGDPHFDTQFQVRVARDQEEKVLFLLNKLQQKSVGNNEINKIHEAEINQFSRLHEELKKMEEENERLKESQITRPTPRIAINGGSNNRAGGKKRKSVEEGERYTAEEFLSETDSDDSDVEDSDGEDPDWQKTPLFKRIKKLKETQSFAGEKRRRVAEDGGGENQGGNSAARLQIPPKFPAKSWRWYLPWYIHSATWHVVPSDVKLFFTCGEADRSSRDKFFFFLSNKMQKKLQNRSNCPNKHVIICSLSPRFQILGQI